MTLVYSAIRSAILEERERCAKVAEERGEEMDDTYGQPFPGTVGWSIATAIREG